LKVILAFLPSKLTERPKEKKSKKKIDDPTSELPPMPPAEKLNSLFEDLLAEMQLAPDRREAMLALPATNKWALICQHRLVEVSFYHVKFGFILWLLTFYLLFVEYCRKRERLVAVHWFKSPSFGSIN